MPRIAYMITCFCLIVFAGLVVSPANAGSRDNGKYVDVAYPPERPSRAWYSSKCCYMKIVRHVADKRQVRYVKVKPSRIEKVMLERKRERAARRERLRKHVSRRDLPRGSTEYKVIVVRRDGERDRCRRKRVRVLSASGGAVWAVKARCY